MGMIVSRDSKQPRPVAVKLRAATPCASWRRRQSAKCRLCYARSTSPTTTQCWRRGQRSSSSPTLPARLHKQIASQPFREYCPSPLPSSPLPTTCQQQQILWRSHARVKLSEILSTWVWLQGRESTSLSQTGPSALQLTLSRPWQMAYAHPQQGQCSGQPRAPALWLVHVLPARATWCFCEKKVP